MLNEKEKENAINEVRILGSYKHIFVNSLIALKHQLLTLILFLIKKVFLNPMKIVFVL